MKDRSLLVVLLFPILFFLVLAGLVWVPRLWIDPEYDFVYSFDQGCLVYELEDDTIDTVNNCTNAALTSFEDNQPELYYYDQEEERTREISLEEANRLDLLDQEESPDGFVLKKNNNDTPFGTETSNNLYLQGNGGSLSIDTPDNQRFSRLVFLGWVQK